MESLLRSIVATIMLAGMASAICDGLTGHYTGDGRVCNIKPTPEGTYIDVNSGEVFYPDGECYGTTSESRYFSYSSCKLNLGRYELSCTQGATREGPTQEEDLRDYCNKRSDGNFHHPTRCEAFVKCLKKESRVTECPAGQQFDAAQKKCEKMERVTCLELVGNTSYGAKGQQRYGEIVLTRDQIRKPGKIMQVKLLHVEGQIKCDSSKQQTVWGCKPGQSKTVITDEKNRVLFNQGVIHQEGENTSLIFNKDLEQSPNTGELPFVMRVWYESDLHKEGNIRSGVHKVTVFVTVVSGKCQKNVTQTVTENPMEKEQCECEKTLHGILQEQRRQISEVMRMHPAKLENKLQELFKQLNDNLEACIRHEQPRLKQRIEEEMKKLKNMSEKDLPKKRLCQQQYKQLKQALEQITKQQPKSDIVTSRRFHPRLQPGLISKELRATIRQQTEEIKQLELMHPRPDLTERLQQKQMQLQQVLQQLRQKYGGGIKAAIKQLLEELRKNLSEESEVVLALIKKQMEQLQRELGEQQPSIQRNRQQLKEIIKQTIQQIKIQLAQHPQMKNMNYLKRKLQSLQRQLQRIQQQCRHSGNVPYENFCLNKRNGNYNHPTTCEKFVICSHNKTYIMDCPTEHLQFDLASNKCVEPSRTTCLQLVGTTTYGTKGDDFGSLVLTQDMVGRTGYLTQVKLVHIDGYVACSTGSSPSRWGCNNEPPQSYTRDIIGTIVTDDQNNELYRQERIPGYNGMSELIIFNNQQTTAPHISSLPYTLRVWYNEDLDDNSEEDNRGRHEIGVYVTIVPHLPTGKTMGSESADPELQGYCDVRNDGDYRHPSRCDEYVSCSNNIPHSMPCPSGLQYNVAVGFCDYPENARCLQFIGTTTFGAKDNQYGTVIVPGFNQQMKGKLVQVKLEHIDGGVTCSGSSMSFWGCNNVYPQTYTREVIGTMVTDSHNQVLMHEERIAGKDGMSPFVVFNKDKSIAPVIAQDPYQIRIWYNEDFNDFSESDNSGSHLINVYATIVPEQA